MLQNMYAQYLLESSKCMKIQELALYLSSKYWASSNLIFFPIRSLCQIRKNLPGFEPAAFFFITVKINSCPSDL